MTLKLGIQHRALEDYQRFHMMTLGWPLPFLWPGQICFRMLLHGWKLIHAQHWVLMYFQVCSNSAYPQHSSERYRTNGPLVSFSFYSIFHRFLSFSPGYPVRNNTNRITEQGKNLLLIARIFKHNVHKRVYGSSKVYVWLLKTTWKLILFSLEELPSLRKCLSCIVLQMSRLMTNQQNGMCAQRRLRSAWASAQSDQSLRCPHEKSLGP